MFCVPLRPVSHRDDELHAYKQNARVAKDVENNGANVVAKWIGSRISQRSCYEVESKVEIGLRVLAIGLRARCVLLTSEKKVNKRLMN